MNFFAQGQKITLTLTLQHVLLAIIWLGWIKKADKASLQQVVGNLISAYDSSREIQDRINTLATANDFTTLVQNVNQERAFMSTICKI